MKKLTSLFLILLALAPLVASKAETISQVQPAEIAFVDFNGGNFLVSSAASGTAVPFTSSPWVVIENKSTLLSFQDDGILISAPGYRLSVMGQFYCTRGTMTWSQIGVRARTPEKSIGGLVPFSILFPAVSTYMGGSFVLEFARDFTEADFAGGSPTVQIVMRNNASSPQGCQVHLVIELK